LGPRALRGPGGTLGRGLGGGEECGVPWPVVPMAVFRLDPHLPMAVAGPEADISITSDYIRLRE